MAQTKTDYGLIYNDDGSLCTTVRPDQIPFSGVQSFAVETTTTNLVTDIDPRNWNNDNTIVELTDDKYMGMPVYKVTMPETTNPRIFVNIPYTDGMTLTGSVYIKGIQYSSVARPYLYFRETRFGSTYKTQRLPTNIGQWQRISVTHTFAGDGSVMFLLYTPTATNDIPNIFYMAMPQVEKKPFASSFVDGTRPKGRLVIPVEDLKFDIVNDDWVISYWKYPVATHDNTQNDYNRCSLGQITSNYSKGYIVWGKERSKNKYRLAVILNNATVMYNINDNTFNPTDYFYHWHYEVMKKQGKVLSYYVDGVKQCEVTIPADKELQTPFDVGLSLGGFTSQNIFYPHNALIANVGNGKLKPGEFTDEHIMAIYEANRAFAQKGGVKIY